jgi:hypothetical protein
MLYTCFAPAFTPALAPALTSACAADGPGPDRLAGHLRLHLPYTCFTPALHLRLRPRSRSGRRWTGSRCRARRRAGTWRPGSTRCPRPGGRPHTRFTPAFTLRLRLGDRAGTCRPGSTARFTPAAPAPAPAPGLETGWAAEFAPGCAPVSPPPPLHHHFPSVFIAPLPEAPAPSVAPPSVPPAAGGRVSYPHLHSGVNQV